MIKELKSCTLLFIDNCVIATIKEGVVFDKTESTLQTNAILEFYKDKPFVYISNRKYSYSVDPTIYNETSKLLNLSAFAVVTKNLSARFTEIERLFLNKPFEVFSDLDEALAWSKNILNK